MHFLTLSNSIPELREVLVIAKNLFQLSVVRTTKENGFQDVSVCFVMQKFVNFSEEFKSSTRLQGSDMKKCLIMFVIKSVGEWVSFL